MLLSNDWIVSTSLLTTLCSPHSPCTVCTILTPLDMELYANAYSQCLMSANTADNCPWPQKHITHCSEYPWMLCLVTVGNSEEIVTNQMTHSLHRRSPKIIGDYSHFWIMSTSIPQTGSEPKPLCLHDSLQQNSPQNVTLASIIPALFAQHTVSHYDCSLNWTK